MAVAMDEGASRAVACMNRRELAQARAVQQCVPAKHLNYEFNRTNGADLDGGLTRIAHRFARRSRRTLDSEGIVRPSGILTAISEEEQFLVDSRDKRGRVNSVSYAG